MKLTWGHGIAMFYSLFVILMVGMVIKSTYHNPHLVQDDYYQLDLDYETFRAKRENARLLKDPLKVNFNDQSHQLEISFPKNMNAITGDISLVRPSNKFLDKKFKINILENNSMILPIPESTVTGRWKVQVDWKSSGKAYYIEKVINL